MHTHACAHKHMHTHAHTCTCAHTHTHNNNNNNNNNTNFLDTRWPLGFNNTLSFIQKFDMENSDEWSLRQPVFAIQLENIERENIDGSLAISVISINISPVKTSRYTAAVFNIGKSC